MATRRPLSPINELGRTVEQEKAIFIKYEILVVFLVPFVRPVVKQKLPPKEPLEDEQIKMVLHALKEMSEEMPSSCGVTEEEIDSFEREMRNPASYTPEDIEEIVREHAETLAAYWLGLLHNCAGKNKTLELDMLDESMLPPGWSEVRDYTDMILPATFFELSDIQKILKRVANSLPPGEIIPGVAADILSDRGIVLSSS